MAGEETHEDANEHHMAGTPLGRAQCHDAYLLFAWFSCCYL